MDTRRGTRWKLDELAERAKVSVRTVRYYVQRGIVPAPEFRGPDTAYGEEHLARLRAIRVLQERHLPLDEIQSILKPLAPEAVARIADGELPATLAASTLSPAPKKPTTEGVAWRRHRLAPGLELHIAEDVSAEVRALADALLAQAADTSPSRRQ